jgi:hypothetical protein
MGSDVLLQCPDNGILAPTMAQGQVAALLAVSLEQPDLVVRDIQNPCWQVRYRWNKTAVVVMDAGFEPSRYALYHRV